MNGMAARGDGKLTGIVQSILREPFAATFQQKEVMDATNGLIRTQTQYLTRITNKSSLQMVPVFLLNSGEIRLTACKRRDTDRS
jgi:hypothetical protein